MKLYAFWHTFSPPNLDGFPLWDALARAKGPIVHEIDGAEHIAADATEELKNFARTAASRVVRKMDWPGKPVGLFHWLNAKDITLTNWNSIQEWARNNDLLWQAGGHAEGSACNAVRMELDGHYGVEYHTYLAAYHALLQLGPRERKAQEKSLQVNINKALRRIG